VLLLDPNDVAAGFQTALGVSVGTSILTFLAIMFLFIR
jgi:hypothetical protein